MKHNALKCLTCNDIIFSTFRNDFRYCKCGDCFVDGGQDYFRIGFKDKTLIEYGTYDSETKEYKKDDINKRRND